MLKQLWKFVRALLLALAALGLIAFFVPRLITSLYGWSRVYTVETAPVERAAVVFGAGLTRSGQPTPVLRDRVEMAARLYTHGKVEKLLMSGGDRFAGFDEADAMQQYALMLGVPPAAIVLDHDGSSTYDTCYRAKAIFGLDSALLVTQAFHLPRALFLCNALGLKAAGVDATHRGYGLLTLALWNVREQFATIAALVDIYISRPVPVLGNPEPIFPQNS